MHIGLQTYKFNYEGGAPHIAPRLRELAQTAEAAGFADFWLVDHFFQMEGVGPAHEAMLEVYTTLGYIAAVTQRLRLGALVAGVIYRYPALLAKTVTTLDVLSGGRAWCGVGAAWYEREALGLGVPFPALATRFEQLEETLHILHRMFAGDAAPYHGQHYHLNEPLNSPLPLSRPRPPILIGGMGEKKTLRLVAQYGDACNFDLGVGMDALRHKLGVLGEHCAAVGRDYATIRRTVVGPMDGKSAGELVELCGQLAALGFQHAIFNVPRPVELSLIEMVGRDVIPAVAGY